jgi:large subunit ribosomal protein L33
MISYNEPWRYPVRVLQKVRKEFTAMARELVILECTECKRRNYTTKKEKRNTPERLEKMKYCKFDRKHTLHKETR